MLIGLAGPSSANPGTGDVTKSPEKVIQKMEITSNQPTVDEDGAERSSVKEEKDDDSDDADSIIHTPEGSDDSTSSSNQDDSHKRNTGFHKTRRSERFFF